jgi:ABC-type multidrug transport system permease subunit
VGVTSLSPRPESVSRTRRGLQTAAVRALILRDWGVTQSYRTGMYTDLVFGFLNLVVYHFISRTLRPRTAGELYGAPSYFAFAAVGIALMVVLQAAITGLARRVREEQLTGTLETLLAQPISAAELALGLAGFPFLFAVFRALAYLLLAGALLGLSFAHTDWLGVLVSFVVSGVVFAGIGIALASLVVVFKRAEAAASAGVFAIGVLGGAVFPTSVLPGWLKPLGAVVPTRFALEALRGALFGAHGWLAPAMILLGAGVVTVGLSLWLFSAAIALVIRQGTVSQY